MARLAWAPRADRDFVAIHDRIAKDSPKQAKRVARELFELAESIRAQPLLGAMVPEYDNYEIRERLLYSYRMIYRVRGDAVEIVRITHASRPLPPEAPV
jgi:toxin ParE1/3/4